MHGWFWLVLLGVFGACGSRTALEEPDPRPLNATLSCPDGPRLIGVGRPTRLEATVTPPSARIGGEWTAVGTEPTLDIVQVDDRTLEVVATSITQETFRYVARLRDGTSLECETEVEAVRGISARCPDSPFTALVGTPTVLTGRVFDEAGVTSAEWRFVDPDLDRDWLTLRNRPVEDGAATAELLAVHKGIARVELVAENAIGDTDSCVVDLFIPEPLEIGCAVDVRTGIDRPVPLIASLKGGGPIAIHTISVGTNLDGTRPLFSASKADIGNGRATILFTPREEGRYRVTHSAIDSYGQSATCATIVIAEPGAPTVQCPDLIETEPLTRVAIRGSASDDEGVPQVLWSILQKPPGSDAAPPFPTDAPVTGFRPDLAGTYVLEMVAKDAAGHEGSCQTQVVAFATEGLRVEMFWDTDRTDMDLHLLEPTATAWFTNLDCHFANCTNGLEWGNPGDDDNPSLDIDDTNGLGPENINIDEPTGDLYDIAVHAFQGRALDNAVTVRIYCGGSTTEPRKTIGPVVLQGTTSPFNNDFWKVARVRTEDDGSCEIEPLLGPDGLPLITTGTAASLER